MPKIKGSKVWLNICELKYLFFRNIFNLSSKINLDKSPSNIQNGIYISVSGIVTSNTFTYIDYHNKILDNQKILKQINQPINELSLIHISEPTRLGMISYAVF